jgi:hypothetical protein
MYNIIYLWYKLINTTQHYTLQIIYDNQCVWFVNKWTVLPTRILFIYVKYHGVSNCEMGTAKQTEYVRHLYSEDVT